MGDKNNGKSDMNILYYLDWFPKLSQSFILNEIHYLVQKGHNIAIFSINEPDLPYIHNELSDIDIEVAYSKTPTPTSVSSVLLRSISDDRISSGPFSNNLRRKAGIRFLTKQCLDFTDSLSFDVDHVHAHFARWNKIPAALVADSFGATSSLTTHAYDLYASRDMDILKSTCNAFDTILTISDYNKQFIDVEIDPNPTVEVVRMGIRTEKFQPTETENESRVLTVARFVEKKGIEYALKAVAAVIEDYPELEYRIIGSGPRKHRYEQIITELEIENNVTILGSVSDNQLIDELDRSTAFLLPCVVARDGNRDGIPVVLMESMAMKTPPITTNVSGISELVINNENGFLCSERSVEDLSRLIKLSLSNTDEIQAMGEAARDMIKSRYDSKVVGDDLLKSIQG